MNLDFEIDNIRFNARASAIIYNKDINQESFICKDNKGQIFYWVNINDLQNYKLLPNSAYELMKNSKNIKHIIEK